MDLSSEGAALDLFRLGPTTMVGRVVAIQVLFGREVKELVLLVMAKLVREWRTIRNCMGYLFGGLISAVNPRNPGVILAFMVGVTILIRRSKMAAVRAEQTYRRKFWSNLMKSARTYDEWAHAVSKLERTSDQRDRDLFDEALVQAKLNDLRLRRLKGGVEDILFCLRADLVRNLGNMCNPELHKARLQTPRVIEEYINEVRYHLRAVCETDTENFSLDEKLAFIHETRHAFGRTALLLSGGAALGAFHLGVVRSLIEHRLLPRVVAGASVGSITCSFAATRTWSELQNFFLSPIPPMHFFDSMGSIIATAHRLLTKGAVQEIGSLQRQMRKLIGDLTFQEAYDLSGRVLGISVSSPRKHEPPRCLNYLTSPHVVIWSAVTASCAFPGLFEAQELMAKCRDGRLVPYHSPRVGHVGPEELKNMKRHWRDGSLESDLPMLQLKELFNVNHFIVSQANPHIAPLLRFKELTRVYGGNFAAKLVHIAEMEVKHRCNQVLEMGFRFGGLAKLFAQDWEGDVTIVMPATFAQFAKIIQNPTSSELRKAVLQGRRCTWEKLSAIQANCGIELMLDECVSELNRRRKAQKEADRAAQADNRSSRSLTPTPTTRRIPSWNRLSLDDDGNPELLHSGGPCGDLSPHRRRRLHNSHDGSDSDSGTENMEVNFSWTRVGAPLMRSPSALKLAFELENNRDTVSQAFAATNPHDNGDDSERGRCHISTPTQSSQVNSWDQRSSKRANKIWVKGVCSPESSDKSEDNDFAEERNFAFSVQLGLKESACNCYFGEREVPSAVCKCSDMDKGLTKHRRRLNLEPLQVDMLSPTGTQNPEDLAIAEVSGREVSRATFWD